MENSDQSFNKLFEQYMFNMAAHLIDKLGKHDQDKLIQFLLNLDAVPPTAQFTHSEVELSLATNISLGPQPKASRKSPTSRRVEKDERIVHIQQRISTYQIQINGTVRYISQVEALIEGVENVRVSANTRLALLNRYQSLRDRYVVYLAKMQELQQKEKNRLDRCQV